MSAKVVLTILAGRFDGEEYAFSDRTLCTIGRGNDCLLQLPNDRLHMDVSRHHCLLDIEPPEVRVRDLGSLNGTFVNGANIGQRPKHLEAGAVLNFKISDHVLYDGDELRIGGTVFRISILDEADGRPEAGLVVMEQEESVQ